MIRSKIFALMVLMLSPALTLAQSTGGTSIVINVQGQVAILSYLSNITVNVPLAQLAPTGCTAGTTAGDFACNSATAQTQNTTVATGELTAPFTAPAAPTFSVNLTSAPLILQNAWTVRSIGGASANAQLQITPGASTALNGPSASQIQIVGYGLRSTGATNNNTATISFPDPGLNNARVGDVRLNLNLSGLTSAGVHTAAGNEFTLTLTNL